MIAAFFFAVFLSYVATAYPSIAPRDGADLALAAATAGVAHPPGYPLFAVLGKSWCAVFPLGAVAYRLNVLSALWGSMAATALFLLVGRAAGPWAGLAAGTGLAWSLPLWKFSLFADVYSLHALLVVGLLSLASGGSGPPSPKAQDVLRSPEGAGERSSVDRRAALSALLFGLGIVNHQTMALLAPALLWLWRRERVGWRRWVPYLALGLALHAFVWIRLGGGELAWRTLLRADYGIFELFGPFSRPFGAALAGRLMAHLGLGLFAALCPPIIVLAALGAWELGTADRRLGAALGLAFLAFGPVYFLATRFDVSGWVARSVLEPAFVVPAIAACAAAGFGVAWVARRGEWLLEEAPLACCLALLCGAWSLAGHFLAVDHRDDLAAYDYGRSLMRLIPEGASAVVAGDTALFSLKYLEAQRRAVRPAGALAEGRGAPQAGSARDREIVGSATPEFDGWAPRRDKSRPLYLVGLGTARMRQLGVWGNPLYPWPAGLVARVLPEPPFPANAGKKDGIGPPATRPPAGGASDSETAAWEVCALRRGRAMRSRDSYSRDVLFSFSYARYLSGLIRESFDTGPRAVEAARNHFLHAVSMAPEDYVLD
ncbi:MAG: DUF2723 domain-containing protein [Elusimicrobia bacterium]|nr:DUF2723 domain-containing protein [Elusimicrobiota bacterium]